MTDELAEMEWNKQDQPQLSCTDGGGGRYVTVMTDEQVELLRRQISAYATICEQLLEMHKAVTAQHDFSGLRLGNLYSDSLMASNGHKITARHRWTPTPMQLQILERLFDQGNGTPSKQTLKEITSELSQHGPISETNVYNWFQNRRARSKRKQLTGVANNVESEAEAEVESPTEMKAKPEDIELHEKSTSARNLYIDSPELSLEMHCFDIQSNNGEPIFPPDHVLRQFGSFSSL